MENSIPKFWEQEQEVKITLPTFGKGMKNHSQFSGMVGWYSQECSGTGLTPGGWGGVMLYMN